MVRASDSAHSRVNILQKYSALGLRRACELIATSDSALGARLRCPAVLRYALELWLLSASVAEQEQALRPVGVTATEAAVLREMTRAWRPECVAADASDAARRKAAAKAKKAKAKAAAAVASKRAASSGMPAMPAPPKAKKKKKRAKKSAATVPGSTNTPAVGAAGDIAAFDALGFRASTTIKNRYDVPLRVARALAAALVDALPMAHPQSSAALLSPAAPQSAAAADGDCALLSFSVAFDEEAPADAAAWRVAQRAQEVERERSAAASALALDATRARAALEIDAARAAGFLRAGEARALQRRLEDGAARAARAEFGAATWVWPGRIVEKSMVESLVVDASSGESRVLLKRVLAPIKSSKRQAEHCAALAFKSQPELAVDPAVSAFQDYRYISRESFTIIGLASPNMLFDSLSSIRKADAAMREAEKDTTVFERSSVRIDLRKHEARAPLRSLVDYVRESGIDPRHTVVAFDFDLTLKAPSAGDIEGVCVRGGEATVETLAELRAMGCLLIVVTAAKVSATNWNTICNLRADQLGIRKFFGDARGSAWESDANALQEPPHGIAPAIDERALSHAEQIAAQLEPFRTLRIRLNDLSEAVGEYDERCWSDATEDGGCVYIAGRGFLLGDYNKPHAVRCARAADTQPSGCASRRVRPARAARAPSHHSLAINRAPSTTAELLCAQVRAYCSRWTEPAIAPKHILFVDDFVVNARNFGAYFAEQRSLSEGSERTVRAMAQLERVTTVWWSAEALFAKKRSGGEASSKASSSAEVRHAVGEFEAGALSLD